METRVTHCVECGAEICQGVLFDEQWVCMDCHSKLSKVRDDAYYRNLLLGLKNKLKTDMRRFK